MGYETAAQGLKRLFHVFLLCDSGMDGMVHSASLCGLTLNEGSVSD